MSFGKLRVLLTLAVRSLMTHKISSAIVGSIIFFGTFLVVLGTALLDTIDHSMAQSVTSSVAGHLQVYSADAHDDLALFGSGFMGVDDVGEIADFALIKKSLEAVPNVRAVVPMGLQFNTITGGNDIDRLIAALRLAVESGKDAEVAAARSQIRAIAKEFEADWQRRLVIAEDAQSINDQLRDLATVQSPDFWQRFTLKPADGLLFLETHLAALVDDGQMVYLRNMGTDLDRFAKLFDRFTIRDGQMVPAGRRGFLFSKRTYETMMKNGVARELDKLNTSINQKSKTIAGDPLLADQARRLPRQYQRITFQLHPAAASDLEKKLRALLPYTKGDLAQLLQSFLAVDDNNFAQRYAFFYANIAPVIRLYSVNVGDTLILRSFTKSGYLKSASVKVYGTFDFKGLEASELAGASNLVDMQTFRDLYGFMTPDKRAELADLKTEVGVADLARDGAETELFGKALVEQRGDPAGFDEFKNIDLRAIHANSDAEYDHLDTAAIDAGLAINAAILLQDPSRLEESRLAIQQVSETAKLGLKVVDWQTASGMVGQFIVVVRIVLYIAIFIIFLVALVIINNAMVMATMERVTEIGTMRAIGAQRNFILVAFLLETLTLGGLAGTLGAGAGAATIRYLGIQGIPASTDIMVFLFSGPRLYPTVGALNLIFGMVVILLVSLVSTLYPARIATRIQPIVAMQAKE